MDESQSGECCLDTMGGTVRFVIREGGKGLARHKAALLVIVLGWSAVCVVALGAMAAARRTDHVAERFLNYSRPSDVDIKRSGMDVDAVARLPGVASADLVRGTYLAPVATNGATDVSAVSRTICLVPTIGGDFRDFNRSLIVAGRLPRADDALEVGVSESLARRLSVAPGSMLRVRAYGPDQAEQLLNAPHVDFEPTGPTIDLQVTGIERQVDDLMAPPAGTPGLETDYLYLTPAFQKHFESEVVFYGGTISVRLRNAEHDIDAFEAALRRLPGGADADVRIATAGSDTAAKVDNSLNSATRVLIVFGVLAGVGGVVATSQVLGQRLGRRSGEARVLHGLGATRSQLARIYVLEVLVVAGAGALVAAPLIALTSAVTPLGFARRAEVAPGLHLDAPVLVWGPVALGALLVAAMGPAIWSHSQARERPRLSGIRAGRTRWRRRSLPGLLRSPAALAGTRWTMRADRRSSERTVFNEAAGAILGVGAVLASLTFATNLARFSSESELQGAGWSGMAGDGQLTDLTRIGVPALDSVPAIVGFSLFVEPFTEVDINGESVSLVGFESLKGAVLPDIVEGRAAEAADEIVLGHTLLQRLHLGVGDDVVIQTGEGEVQRHVVGSAVFWSPNGSGVTFGEGAMVTLGGLEQLVPGASDSGGTLLFTLAPDVDRDEVVARLDSQVGDLIGPVSSPTVPDDLRGLDGVRSFVLALAGAVAALAVLLFIGTVIAMCRGRRLDLAILSALGCGRKQLTRVIRWHVTLIAVVGGLIGIPLGIIVGRWAWSVQDRDLEAMVGWVTPWLTVVLVLLVVVLIAIVLTSLPARRAVRRDVGTMLRSE